MSRSNLLCPALLLMTAIFLLIGGGPVKAGKQTNRSVTTGSPPSKVRKIAGKPSKAADGGRGGNAALLVPLAGSLSFSASQYSVSEPDGVAMITLRRTGGTDNQVVARVTATDLTTSRADHIAPGALDTRFNPASGTQGLAIDPLGRILTGSARLNPDGSLDTSFHPTAGVPGLVRTVTLQPDGKVIVGGNFALSRFTSDGILDTSFNPGIGLSPNDGPDYRIRSTALQPDGKILVGGFFKTANGFAGYARLNANGSLDSSFPAAGDDVYSIAVQPDGKVLVEGTIRLNADSSPDNTFNSGGANGIVRAIILQPDGKIIIGGDFTTVGGVTRNGIARLNSNGSLDTSFNPGTGVTGNIVTGVQTVSLQPDGKIIIGGDFAFFNGTSRSC